MTIDLGPATGFVVKTEDGRSFYFAGDTELFGDMRLIAELHEPEIAFLPIGGHFTMGPEAAALAARMLAVRQVVPMHYGTSPVLTGRPKISRASSSHSASTCSCWSRGRRQADEIQNQELRIQNRIKKPKPRAQSSQRQYSEKMRRSSPGSDVRVRASIEEDAGLDGGEVLAGDGAAAGAGDPSAARPGGDDDRHVLRRRVADAVGLRAAQRAGAGGRHDEPPRSRVDRGLTRSPLAP